jgi:hypothetical protein
MRSDTNQHLDVVLKHPEQPARAKSLTVDSVVGSSACSASRIVRIQARWTVSVPSICGTNIELNRPITVPVF